MYCYKYFFVEWLSCLYSMWQCVSVSGHIGASRKTGVLWMHAQRSCYMYMLVRLERQGGGDNAAIAAAIIRATKYHQVTPKIGSQWKKNAVRLLSKPKPGFFCFLIQVYCMFMEVMGNRIWVKSCFGFVSSLMSVKRWKLMRCLPLSRHSVARGRSVLWPRL